MKNNAKYDVFVSYSRKDYVDAGGCPVEGCAVAELLDFLGKNGVSYWFDKNGVYSGSEFVEVITDAITESKMMIFVSSENSNSSAWTTGEIFEALEQKKLVIPFKIDDSPYNKKFRMMLRPLDFIDYQVNHDCAFESLLKAVTVGRMEYEKMVLETQRKKEEAEERRRKAQIKKEIKDDTDEYLRYAATLENMARQIIAKQQQIGIVDKSCPVCRTVSPIGSRYCRKCGWTFNPRFDACPQGEADHIFLMQSISGSSINELSEKGRTLATVVVGSVEFRMVHVEGGTFTMGEGPEAQQVTLPSYSIGETPVTQAMWVAVMGGNPSRFKGDNLPVEQVSWNDCRAFIGKLNQKTGRRFRLPSEAEWEFAALGGCANRDRLYCADNVDDVAWYDANSEGRTHPVKMKSPNGFGLFDMSGNVWEWCRGCDDDDSATCCFRICRGGSWFNDAGCCRPSFRLNCDSDFSSNDVGFRLVLSE